AAMEPGHWTCSSLAPEGSLIPRASPVARMEGSARILLRAERVILNFITHLSGVANLVRRYVKALEGSATRLLDTRKTLPGLRYPEKYAVLVGGGCNHRKDLGELLMLKDNHIDAAGGIAPAVQRLRAAYGDSLPIEVECRTIDEVRAAVSCAVERIMLDNMTPVAQKDAGGRVIFDPAGQDALLRALALVPPSIEVEISGGVNLENIGALARLPSQRQPDFISVGRLTHSAPAADFSMRISRAQDKAP
ncbi:carboxylating nicotinate-nucleotide diphosphorylase, partial [Desulfovibrio sp. OttesenSCG-928-A18]|nr:carboxylating nicotinate-nucleotide diphosphorylase [Desulfovibrio sp. OttesenSCG-928-A18]